MKISTGNILLSAASLNDAIFDNALVFITEHNEKGSIGFVVNKKADKFLHQLVEFKNSIAFPLYYGGPVDNEHLFFIHSCPHLIEGGTAIANSIYYGGNFKQAVALLNSNTITTKDIKIFIGYCGWDCNQLEEEIEEGGWLVKEVALKDVLAY
jgi:putative transcriptional regulator